jgi:hypothetical protein
MEKDRMDAQGDFIGERKNKNVSRREQTLEINLKKRIKDTFLKRTK